MEADDVEWPRGMYPRRRIHGGPDYMALILDMDGLLVDTEIADRRAWRRAAQDYGCSVTDTDFERVLGRTPADTRDILRATWKARCEPFENHMAIEGQKNVYFSEESISLKPGAKMLLDWTILNNIPVAIASSSNRQMVESHLANTGLGRKSVDVVVGGDEVEHGKPAPDIFLLAARRLRTQSDLCLVLEDAEMGIEAAATANMISILVPDTSVQTAPTSAHTLQLAYRCFESLTDVLDHLSQ